MTHVTYERKAQLDAAAEERAAFLEEVKHQVSGVHVQSLIDEPEPYHAGQLTPAYHVPGNVPKLPVVIDLNPGDTINADLSITPADPAEPSAADLDAVAAEESAKEQTIGNA